MTTPLGAPEIVQNQPQQHLTHNEALHHHEMWLRGVKSRTIDTPPGSPAEGDAYIMPLAPTGDWSSLTVNTIALWFNSVWEPIAPAVGPDLYVEDEDQFITWNGSEYRGVASTFGINAQTADYTLVLTDLNTIVSLDVGVANTLTIPTCAAVKFGPGSMVAVWQKGAGATSIVGDAGVTVLGSFPVAGFAWLINVAVDTWVIK